MATLEKIRSRSALLLIIVGAALLAFIIGDFFTSGRTLFGTGTTLAKVGNKKIDVQEFQQRVQAASQQMQGRKIDGSVLNQQVLNTMITEKLFDQEAEDLGLNVTSEELTSVMLGDNAAYVNRMVQQQTGAPDAKTFYDMAFNPSKYGVPAAEAQQYQQYWLDLEKQMEQNLLRQKFQTLFAGTFVGNDLDAKALYEDNASTAKIAYVKSDYSALNDDEYAPSDAEIKALYNDEKNLYALSEPVSTVNYIAVDIAPSAEDKVKGQAKVEAFLEALNADATSVGNGDTEFDMDRAKQVKSTLNSQTSEALAEMQEGEARLVSNVGNNYTLAKLFGRSNELAEVTVDFMVVDGAAKADSLIAALNAGASFDSISAQALQSQKAYKVSLLDNQVAELRDVLAGATVGRYFTPDTAAAAQYTRIFNVTEKPAPVEVVDLATYTFEVLPSAATVNKLQNELMDYVAAHNNAKAFADSAQAAGYTTFPAQVTPSTPSIGNLEDSHAAVAWVVDAKKGQVSQVFGDEQSGKFFAVALNDVYDEAFVPVRDPQLNATYTARARNDKKAAALMEQYNGKASDLAGYAKLLGVTPDTTDVNFGQVQVPGIGIYEAEILGKVANAKAGQFLGPVKGNNAIVFMQVTEVAPAARPYDATQDQARYNQQRGAQRMMGNMEAIMLGNKKVKNNMTTFFK
ncbi:MAG: SurA N-terminal domain-containing protein [Duncaniella sp.]|nr:SurA N-terminal domain-containing protein [Duncaniella sp.]